MVFLPQKTMKYNTYSITIHFPIHPISVIIIYSLDFANTLLQTISYIILRLSYILPTGMMFLLIIDIFSIIEIHQDCLHLSMTSK